MPSTIILRSRGKSQHALEILEQRLLLSGVQFAQPPTLYPAGIDPAAITHADFNGDGKIDLAVADREGSSVSVLLNLGGGAFAPRKTYPAGSYAAAIVAADFNGDRKPDIAVADEDEAKVSILINDGKGGFLPAVKYAVGFSPRSIVAADFNGDGKIDLATGNFGSTINGQGSISILLNKGAGSFAPRNDLVTSENIESITAADFNGDGRPDIGVAHYLDSVGILFNSGSGVFPQEQTYFDFEPYTVAAADMNGDGHMDLVVSDRNGTPIKPALTPGPSATVFLNNGDGTLDYGHPFNSTVGPAAMTIADFNGDLLPDVALSDGKQIAVLLNHPTNIPDTVQLDAPNLFSAGGQVASGLLAWGITAADFNGDGTLDVATTNWHDQTVAVLVHASAPGLSLAPLKLTGSFQFNAGTGEYTASGPVAFSYGNGPALLTVTGSVSYDHNTIHASGLVAADIGSLKLPNLFNGSFTIPVGSASTSTLSINTRDLKIVGALFPVNGLSLSSTGITLKGSVSFANPFGAGPAKFSNGSGLYIDSQGIHFLAEQSFTITKPLVVRGVKLTTNAKITLSYDSAFDGLRLQGSFSASIVRGAPSLTFDLSGANYIEHDATRGTTIVGKITVSNLNVPLIPKIVSLTEVALAWDSTTKAVTATANLSFAGHGVTSLATELSQQGNINALQIDTEDVNENLGDGFFLQLVNGSIEHLAPSDTSKVVVDGQIEISDGPKIPIDLPKSLGGTIEGYIWSVDAKGTFDFAGKFSITGTTSEIGNAAKDTGLATGSATLSIDVQEGTCSFTATQTALGGIFSVSGNVTISTANGGSIDVSGTGSLSFPAVTVTFRGTKYTLAKEELLGVHVKFHITQDLASSYVEAWGNEKVPWQKTPGLLGLRINLDGTTTTLDSQVPPT